MTIATMCSVVLTKQQSVALHFAFRVETVRWIFGTVGQALQAPGLETLRKATTIMFGGFGNCYQYEKVLEDLEKVPEGSFNSFEVDEKTFTFFKMLATTDYTAENLKTLPISNLDSILPVIHKEQEGLQLAFSHFKPLGGFTFQQSQPAGVQ